MKSPLKTIRAYCLTCCGQSYSEVKACTCGELTISPGDAMESCPLFPYRLGHRPSVAPMRPLRAIRAKCLDCYPEGAWSGACEVEKCLLYAFRMGHHPGRVGKGPRKSSFLSRRPQGEGGVSENAPLGVER